MNNSTIINNQRDRTVNHLNPHHNNNDDDDDDENNEIQPTREDQLTSIRNLLDSRVLLFMLIIFCVINLCSFFLEITKEHGPGGLDGESATSKSIADQLNYAKTAKYIDLKLLKKELKQK